MSIMHFLFILVLVQLSAVIMLILNPDSTA